ncbi:unnamed protein product [Closterium sp. NIES-54]
MPSWHLSLSATERSKDPLSPPRKSTGSGCLVHLGLPQGQAAWKRNEATATTAAVAAAAATTATTATATTAAATAATAATIAAPLC